MCNILWSVVVLSLFKYTITLSLYSFVFEIRNTIHKRLFILLHLELWVILLGANVAGKKNDHKWSRFEPTILQFKKNNWGKGLTHSVVLVGAWQYWTYSTLITFIVLSQIHCYCTFYIIYHIVSSILN